MVSECCSQQRKEKEHAVGKLVNIRHLVRMDVGGKETYLTTCGAITLHGPHQVAKKSTTMSWSSFIASSKAFFLMVQHVSVTGLFMLATLPLAFAWDRRVAPLLRAECEGRASHGAVS